MTASALEVAKWFIKNDLDNPRNKYDGNMKIQKLLYFAQLIHLALYGDVLFDDPILAYENGSVVEHVRQRYKNDNSEFVAEAKNANIVLTDEEQNTLILTAEIFGKLSASELSDLNHLHRGWREALERSKRNGFHYRENGVISMTSVKNHDLEKVKQMLKAHQSTKQINDNCEVINGTTFYYDPRELTITDEIISILESFRGTESAYSISLDENREIVIY
ncbi:MAG: hypothetical protein CVU89_14445 [Firmicutes bacterium HGW-Firmicutes-14]|nr:MAG: hypothetical protein CVU89_14445 [Firmicutes bacterium HGW-Firmicutes-14]